MTRDNYGKFGLSSVRGVVVDKVMDSSPAAAAGLQAGDVILRFNGEELTGTRKLSRLVSEAAPDHRVTLTILRGGREQELTATSENNRPPGLEQVTLASHFRKNLNSSTT